MQLWSCYKDLRFCSLQELNNINLTSKNVLFWKGQTVPLCCHSQKPTNEKSNYFTRTKLTYKSSTLINDCSILFSVLNWMRPLSSISCTDDNHSIAFCIRLWFWKRIELLTVWWLGLSSGRHVRHLVQQMEKRWCIFWLKFKLKLAPALHKINPNFIV